MTDTPSERIINDLFSYWLRHLFRWPDGEWWTEAPKDDRWECLHRLLNRMLDQWWEPFDEYRYPFHAVPKRNPSTGLAEAVGVDTRTLADLLRDAGVDRTRQIGSLPGPTGGRATPRATTPTSSSPPSD